MDNQTITLTFCEAAENHVGMEIIGNQVNSGLTLSDLEETQKYFTGLGATCELVKLNGLIKDKPTQELLGDTPVDIAHLLIVRKGLKYICEPAKLLKEQMNLKFDTKAYMRGRVVNKRARYNLCFSDFAQEPDYENKKGRIVNFSTLPELSKVRAGIENFMDNPCVKNLQCECNYYYDIKTTYIGFHGDSERKIVIGVRLGADFPLHFQWYWRTNKIGSLYTTVLADGDIYLMSDKAVGYDWKKPSKPTLRHGAGDIKLIS